MPEDYIVRNCAPTLARLKTGSLFGIPMESREDLSAFLRRTNLALSGKGVRLVPLRLSGKRALLYLYRPSMLHKDLSCPEAQQLLADRGYPVGAHDACVACLARRIQEHAEFPHEVGLFLGYPPEDVAGFISNRATQYKCVGSWKVYGDADQAQKTFALYKKCTKIYCSQWAQGADLDRLTVAG